MKGAVKQFRQNWDVLFLPAAAQCQRRQCHKVSLFGGSAAVRTHSCQKTENSYLKWRKQTTKSLTWRDMNDYGHF